VSGEQVRLAIPAEPEYIRLARLTAAGLASRLGFSYDEVEDLRIAVDELCYLLLDPSGPAKRIVLTFVTDDSRLVVRGEATGGRRPGEFAELSEQILGAIVDEYDLAGDGEVMFRMAHRDGG
jgi:anti-sigma regulatory factor (Ser/Thr protein kinase)